VSIVVIARKVEFAKLFVFGKTEWAPKPEEVTVFGKLIDTYNDFCTHAQQNFDRAWINKDTGHAIFDVKFSDVIDDVKYELTASLIVDIDSPESNTKPNGQFHFNRYESLNDRWVWKASWYSSATPIGSNTQVEDIWLKQSA
jgi:hypothetical protein